MFNADDRASRCASALWSHHQWEHADYEMDGSGELGDRIAKGHQLQKVAILEEHGFTPETWTALLNERLSECFTNHYIRAAIEVEPMESWVKHNTYVYAMGEWSSLAFLEGGE